MLFFLFITIGLGVAGFVSGIFKFSKYYSVLRNGERTTGEVIDVHETNHFSRFGPDKAPVIKYQLVDSINTNGIVSIADFASRYITYRIGQKVPIIYNRNDPYRFFINDIFWFFEPLLPMLMGLFIISLGIFVYNLK